MPRFLIPLGIVAAGLIIYSLIECLMTPRHQVRAMPKAVWILIIVLVPLVGALLWLFLGRRRGSVGGGGATGGPARPQRPQSPDDDAAFLRQLDVQRKQQSRQAELDRREAELKAQEKRGTKDNGTPESGGSNTPKPDGGADQS
ncbi:PLD nuclease N-terminal domain-containing protein [Citricoccus nitrophenolicus]|uniref:Phospholipase D-like protein n=1 Tax=Citricoccus muralis TaxID=169134 RepID=A0A3D9LEY0_9MICC|nr:PLD nuclease N-terminal domain-containing protein [Citricoccus muralis]REE03987.1 phospholipase D-like protein [Citricoccus muralis]